METTINRHPESSPLLYLSVTVAIIFWLVLFVAVHVVIAYLLLRFVWVCLFADCGAVKMRLLRPSDSFCVDLSYFSFLPTSYPHRVIICNS